MTKAVSSRARIAAIVLILWDGVLNGSAIFSMLICPFWIIISAVRSLTKRPGWKVALLRLAVPLVTLTVVTLNSMLQRRIANVHGDRIIEAVEKFHSTNQKFPESLDQLVPQFLDSIPRTKYCVFADKFMYHNDPEQKAWLMWVVIPPFGRHIYHFDSKQHGSLD